MSSKKILGTGLIILMITLGAFWVSTGLNSSDEEVIWLTGKPQDTIPAEPKPEIKQVLEYGWNWSLDSCTGEFPFFYQVRFDPLPEINQPSKIYVKLKSCWEWKKNEEPPNIFVIAGEEIMDFTQLEPKWLPPIKKGDIYEGSITIVPREIGTYGIVIALITGDARFHFGFHDNGELAYISNRGSIRISDMPHHPLITESEIYVKFNGKYVTNLFHITPPLSLHDTSTVNYRVVTKVDYPDGLKIVMRDHKNFSYKMIPGPVAKGDTLRGSFIAVPPRVGENSIGLGIEEPPREGVDPQNDGFSALYYILNDGKVSFISNSRKGFGALFNYYKKKGVQLE